MKVGKSDFLQDCPKLLVFKCFNDAKIGGFLRLV